MDGADIDCLSCAHAIKDFTNVVNVACGHGFIHYNCLYFNNGCPECQGKLVAANDDQQYIQFRPRDEFAEQNLKFQITAINQSLSELKNALQAQNLEQNKMMKVIEGYRQELQSKDEKILELQKELYALKLEKVENIKKDLQEKLEKLDNLS